MPVRWPMYGVFVLLMLPLDALLHQYGGLPLAVFDADLAMSRSFLYAPLWLAIAAAYLGIAAALGVAASAFGLKVTVTVTVTIVVTLLVERARRRLAQRAARWT